MPKTDCLAISSQSLVKDVDWPSWDLDFLCSFISDIFWSSSASWLHTFWIEWIIVGLLEACIWVSFMCFCWTIRIYLRLYISLLWNLGRLACKLYEHLRQEAAAVKIQKNLRRFVARKSYLTLRSSAIALQTGLRTMTARNEFRFRKQTKATIIIQVASLSKLNICYTWCVGAGQITYNLKVKFLQSQFIPLISTNYS